MEPMTLGSPTHSPSGSPNVGYLPPFLLGEINAPATPPRTNSLSPTKARTLAFAYRCPQLDKHFSNIPPHSPITVLPGPCLRIRRTTGSPTSPMQSSTPDQKMYRQSLSMHQQAMYNQQNMFSNMTASPNMSYQSKPNGPPIEDLFDTIKSNDGSVNKSLFQDNSFVGYSNNSLMQNSYLGNNHHNQSMMSPWQDGCQEIEEHWVTVFGFPPNAANTILARFSNCGPILDKQYPTQGNWAHIRFATRAEKERAMSLSGRQVLPGVMVGVVECREPPHLPPSNSVNCPERQTTGTRSLCPTPLPSAPVPQKSNGLVSKALDYVFGW